MKKIKKFRKAAKKPFIIASLKEGEEIPDGPIETIDYSKDYEGVKKFILAHQHIFPLIVKTRYLL